MNSLNTPQAVLEQIAQISPLERGKLCVMREGPNGPYYSHQTWDDGKNVTRYVPRDQVPALQQALDGYQRFQSLVTQYVQLMEEQSRAARIAGVKKNEPGPNLRLAQEQEIQQIIHRFQA